MIILQKNRTGKLFLRSTALLTLVLFSWTTVSLANPEILAPALPTVSVVNPGSHFAIPAALGTLQETHFPADFSSQSPLIIHIQDVHALPEAQRKIEKLIRLLQRKYGFSLLLLEGAQTRLDSQLFHFFKDPQKNLKMADYLLKNGEFSGPERFLLKQEARPGPVEKIRAEGIEDENFYHDNLAAFKRVYAGKEEADWFLGKMEARVEKLSTLIWKPSLRKFAHAWKSFHRDKTEFLSFLKILRRTAQKELNIDLGDPKTQLEYPHLIRIFMLDAHSPELDAEKLTEEKARLLDYFRSVKLKDSLIRDFDRRVRAGAPLAKGKKELRGIFEEVYRQAPKDFSFRKYPEIALWSGTLVLREELRSVELMAEADQISDKIFNHAAQSQEQKELAALWKDLVTLEKLFSLELIRAEYRGLLVRKEVVEPVGIFKRIKGLEEGAQKFDFPEKDLKGAEVEKIFHQALEFYQGAERREQKMAEHALHILKNAAAPRAILITGGFHSEGLKEAFKGAKVGYVEISPALHSELNHRKNYLRSILGREAEESHLKNPAYLIPRQAQMNLGANLRWRDAWIDRAYQMAASLGAETRIQGHSLGSDSDKGSGSYHFRVDSILQSYRKIYLLYDPAAAQYESRPYEAAPSLLDEHTAGEVHAARFNKLHRALEYLKARADELGDPVMRERAEKIGKSTTVMGVDMPTRLLFYRPEDRTSGVYHIGRRRSLIYFPLLFLDSLTGDEAGIEELALYLDRAERWIEAYHESTHRIEQEGLPAETIYELMEKARQTFDADDKKVLRSLHLEEILKRLDSFAEQDEKIKQDIILPEIAKLRQEITEVEDQLMQRQAVGQNLPNRDDYFDLAQLYGRLAHLEENTGNHLESVRFYRAQTDALRDLQRVDEGQLPLEMQEGIARILLRTGLYEEFLKELEIFLTGKGFARKLKLREKNILSDLIMKSGKIFESELQYILLSHQEGASKEDLEKIQRVSGKIREFFAEARQRVELEDAAKRRILPQVNIVPVVTPLTSAGEVDAEGIKNLVEHLAALGVEAILVMGATGEFHALENAKRLETLRLFKEALRRNSMMLFANVTGDTEDETLQNIREVEHFSEGIVDALVIAPLYYLKSSAEIPDHFGKIKTQLPVVLYNNPGITRGENIDPAVLTLLKGKFVGLKDSSGDMNLLREYLKHTIVYQGDETQIVAALEAGARGAVSSMGNVFRIDLFGEDVTPAVRDQIQTEITAKVPPLTAGRKKIVAGLKHYLSLRGIIGDTVAASSPRLEEQEKRTIEGLAASLGSEQVPNFMDSALHVLPQADQMRIDAVVRFITLILQLGSMNETGLEQASGHREWFDFDNIPGEKVFDFFLGLKHRQIDLSVFSGDWEENALHFLEREHALIRDIKLTPQFAFRTRYEAFRRGASISDKTPYTSVDKIVAFLMNDEGDRQVRYYNASVVLQEWGVTDVVDWVTGALDRVALVAERKDGSKEAEIAREFLSFFVSHLFESVAMTHAFMVNRSMVEGFLDPVYAKGKNVGVVYLLSGSTHLYHQALQIAQESGAEASRLHGIYVNRKILEGDEGLLKEYLRQQGIPDYDTLVIVDIGFHGTVAKKITDLLAEFPRALQKIHTRLLAMSEVPYSHGAMEAMGFNHLLEQIRFLPDDKNRAALNLITHLIDTSLPAQNRSPVTLKRDSDSGIIQPALEPSELPVFAGIVRDEMQKETGKLLFHPIAYPALRHPVWDQWLPDGAAENLRNRAASLGDSSAESLKVFAAQSLGAEQVWLPVTLMFRVRHFADEARKLLQDAKHLSPLTIKAVQKNLEEAGRTNEFDSVYLNLLKAGLFFSHSRDAGIFEKIDREIQQLLIDILTYRDGYAAQVKELKGNLKPMDHPSKVLAVMASQHLIQSELIENKIDRNALENSQDGLHMFPIRLTYAEAVPGILSRELGAIRQGYDFLFRAVIPDFKSDSKAGQPAIPRTNHQNQILNHALLIDQNLYLFAQDVAAAHDYQLSAFIADTALSGAIKQAQLHLHLQNILRDLERYKGYLEAHSVYREFDWARIEAFNFLNMLAQDLAKTTREITIAEGDSSLELALIGPEGSVTWARHAIIDMRERVRPPGEKFEAASLGQARSGQAADGGLSKSGQSESVQRRLEKTIKMDLQLKKSTEALIRFVRSVNKGQATIINTATNELESDVKNLGFPRFVSIQNVASKVNVILQTWKYWKKGYRRGLIKVLDKITRLVEEKRAFDGQIEDLVKIPELKSAALPPAIYGTWQALLIGRKVEEFSEWNERLYSELRPAALAIRKWAQGETDNPDEIRRFADILERASQRTFFNQDEDLSEPTRKNLKGIADSLRAMLPPKPAEPEMPQPERIAPATGQLSFNFDDDTKHPSGKSLGEEQRIVEDVTFHIARIGGLERPGILERAASLGSLQALPPFARSLLTPSQEFGIAVGSTSFLESVGLLEGLMVSQTNKMLIVYVRGPVDFAELEKKNKEYGDSFQGRIRLVSSHELNGQNYQAFIQSLVRGGGKFADSVRRDANQWYRKSGYAGDLTSNQSEFLKFLTVVGAEDDFHRLALPFVTPFYSKDFGLDINVREFAETFYAVLGSGLADAVLLKKKVGDDLELRLSRDGLKVEGLALNENSLVRYAELLTAVQSARIILARAA